MAALLAGGSFAVHQLRFALAYGPHSSDALAQQGHAYLTVLAPLVIGALMIAAAEFAGSLVRAGAAATVPRLTRLWATSTVTLLGVYCVQELAEGFLSSGHAAGLPGVFADGGWLSVPLAIALGLVIALLMRGAAAVVALLAERRRRVLPRPEAAGIVATGDAPTATAALLVAVAGPRAPPLLSA